MFSWIGGAAGALTGLTNPRPGSVIRVTATEMAAMQAQGSRPGQVTWVKVPDGEEKKPMTKEDIELFNGFKDKALEQYYDDNAVVMFNEGYSKEEFIKNGMTYFNDHICAYEDWNRAYYQIEQSEHFAARNDLNNLNRAMQQQQMAQAQNQINAAQQQQAAMYNTNPYDRQGFGKKK